MSNFVTALTEQLRTRLDTDADLTEADVTRLLRVAAEAAGSDWYADLAQRWHQAGDAPSADRDSVEQQLAREALHESEERFRIFSQLTSDFAFALRVKADGSLVQEWATEKFIEITGFEFEEAEIQDDWLSLVYPEDMSVALGFLEALLSGEADTAEFRILTKQGDVRWLKVQCYVERQGILGPGVRIYGAARDITERKRVEETLRQRNRELALLNRAGQAFISTLNLDEVLGTILEEVRHLMKVVACSIWLIDFEKNELVCQAATDPRSDIMLGWRLEMGEGLAGWVAQTGESLNVPNAKVDERHFADVDRQTGLSSRSILSVALWTRERVIGVLQVIDEAIDRFTPAEITLVESLASEAAIAIENARLYTEQQERAAELARALEQQQELDRLKSEFIQNVSHELRTPLTIARGYAELLSSGELGELQPQQREPLNIIVRRIHLLVKMVSDITAILRLEQRRTRPQPVNLSALVQESLTDFQAAADGADLALSVEVAPQLPAVPGDPTELQRVLDNLVSNALKFTPAGGRVDLHLGQEQDTVVLEVADTGIGIPQDKLERVFERFYQVDGSASRRYGGTGLGLALVKEIVEAFGGQVSVSSVIGEGSTFRVTLPVFKD
jgi:PAS domain S-box-containing protein